MRYRTAFLLALLSALVASASAAEPAVVVQPPMIRVVQNEQLLHDVCGPDGEFDACTRFVAFRLRANCTSTGDRWSVEAFATFRPWIRLWHMASLAHEQLHIDDIRRFVERYVVELGQEQFATRDTCDAAALDATRGFEGKMREFAERSNAERHPRLRRPTQLARH
jgi:hypothetical protein